SGGGGREGGARGGGGGAGGGSRPGGGRGRGGARGARRFSLPSPLNKALAGAAWDSRERSTLASPIAGSGVAAGMIERGLLTAIVEHGLDRAFEVAAGEIERRGITFTREGKKLEGRDANRGELRQRFDRFAEKAMPL